MGQSSNDVIPAVMHVATYLAVVEELLPALRHLAPAVDDSLHRGVQLEIVRDRGNALAQPPQGLAIGGGIRLGDADCIRPDDRPKIVRSIERIEQLHR